MHFYCEHHAHIRTLHISVTLPSPADDLTSLDIYNRKTLRLRHAFQTYSIALPASLAITTLPAPIITGSTRTYRVPADAIASSLTNDGPLSTASRLSSLLCTSCNGPVMHLDDMTWLMLPSENWSEMMDSWHCHRGVTDVHHHETHDQYVLPDHVVSAAERIRARRGRGWIGTTYLLVHRHHVPHSQKQTSTRGDEGPLLCACGSVLGDVDAEECRIWKRRVWDGREPVASSVYTVTEMLSHLQSSSIHRFVVHAPDHPEKWTIWILAPDARVTATGVSVVSPGMRVCKVMYRKTVEADLDQEDVEQIALDSSDLSTLVDSLHENSDIARGEGVEDWMPSFLQRYEEPLSQQA